MLTTSDPMAVANKLRPLLLQLSRHLRQELTGLGITAGQAALMHTIRTHPGIGLRDLARLEGVSAPAMSGYVDRLENAGLVSRQRPTTGDRRRVGLIVSPEGLRVLRSARSRRTAWLAQRLRRLSPEQLVALDRALDPLQALLAADGEPA
jgi:DNA-binding MarR family transcriptional regulator